MQNSFVETLIGAAVLVIAGAFFFYAYNRTDTGAVTGGYALIAKFDRIDGINVGSDVRMSGIKIGTVTNEELDQKTYRALIRMSIRSDIKIPDDSSIRVATVGLLGGSYLSVSAGGNDTSFASGGEFSVTQGSIDLIGLLGKTMFGGDDQKPKPPSSVPAPGATPAPSTP